MAGKKIVILDGAGPGDTDLQPMLDVLSSTLQTDGALIEKFPLREMKLAHCLGCFHCWIKTPGICVEADAGREIAKAVVRSDVTVFFTPVTFGGYSPALKKMVDRFVQIASPLFGMDHGEVHHPRRYAQLPRLMMVGVQRHPNVPEARIFKTLAGRNAINFHPPSYAAEVTPAAEGAVALRRRFESLLTRADALPFGAEAAALMPAPVLDVAAFDLPADRRALLLVGSPKTDGPSTSGILGGYLLDRLKGHGWETETLTLRANLSRPEGERELLARVERAGLVVLTFPLYVDALPYLVTKALAVMAGRRQSSAQRFVAIVNSGFPETHQNAVAMAICREFAAQSGFTWAGGLPLGGGGVIGGQPIGGAKSSGPTVKYVTAALDMAAAALAEGRSVPPEAVNLFSKNRIPFALWRPMYSWMAGRSFQKLAARNGLTREKLLAQPYAA